MQGRKLSARQSLEADHKMKLEAEREEAEHKEEDEAEHKAKVARLSMADGL